VGGAPRPDCALRHIDDITTATSAIGARRVYNTPSVLAVRDSESLLPNAENSRMKNARPGTSFKVPGRALRTKACRPRPPLDYFLRCFSAQR